MTKREGCILTAYTGILMINLSDFRRFLDNGKAPDPFISISHESAEIAFDSLKSRYEDEFKLICENLIDDLQVNE